MRRMTAGLLGVLAIATAGATIAWFVDAQPPPPVVAPAIEPAEHARAIAMLRPQAAGRPLVAILALNDGTEVADLLTTFGVLRAADVADVVVVAEREGPIRLYPGGLRALPQATAEAFDRRYPGGADYVVVPAMEPHDDPFAVGWLLAQRASGARIVSVCNGSLTLGAAGLLDGRRATSHWSTVRELRARHPTMRWVGDRRYVTDGGVTTATGITASMPLMLALVEAIGGRGTAERTARELGMDHWDARHASGAFRLTAAHRWTFVRNKLSRWAHQPREVAIEAADEIALGLAVDAWSRTELVSVVPVAPQAQVRGRRGLVLLAERIADAPAPERALPPLPEPPANTPADVLAWIAATFDVRTAEYVALTLEYPWRTDPVRITLE